MYIDPTSLGQSVSDIKRVQRLLPQLIPANLYGFEFKGHALTADLRKRVDVLAAIVARSQKTKTPIRRVILVGHTDDRGGSAYNDKLGLRRADAVRARLLAAMNARHPGLSNMVKIETKTRGKTVPAIKRRSRAARSRNRRVEVFVMRGVVKTTTLKKRLSTKVTERTRQRIRDADRRRQSQIPLTFRVPPAKSRGSSIAEKARSKAEEILRSFGVPRSVWDRIISSAKRGLWGAVGAALTESGLGSQARKAATKSLKAVFTIRW